MQAYRKIRNKGNRLNIELKRSFYLEKICSSEGESKGTWKTLSQVINKTS